jgi:hypothetical protein
LNRTTITPAGFSWRGSSDAHLPGADRFLMRVMATYLELVKRVKPTRANWDDCRTILIDLHCGALPFDQAGPVEREALRRMMEEVRRENERAEMLLIAMAFYSAEGLKKGEAPRQLEGLDLLPLPEGCAVG